MGLIEARRRLMTNGLLPPMYRRCDYLQTTGYNSRIDTGVPGNDQTLILDFDYATVVRHSYGGAIGNYINEQTKCWRLLNPSGTGDTRNYLFSALNRRAGSSSTISVVPDGESMIGKRINFRLSFGRCVSTYGSYSATVTPAATDASEDVSDRNITIGALYPAHSGNATPVGRFWHFKIWSQGNLIRNYIPCIRQRDSKAGFWDTVNRTFNPSIGSVDFIAGYDT